MPRSRRPAAPYGSPEHRERQRHGALYAQAAKRRRAAITAPELRSVERGEIPASPAMARYGREASELVARLAADRGGWDDLAEGYHQVLRNIGRLELLASARLARFAETEDGELVPQIISAINGQRALLAMVGLERAARDVPSLDEYLRARAAQTPASATIETQPDLQAAPTPDRDATGQRAPDRAATENTEDTA